MSAENREMCQQYYIYSFIFVHGCGACVRARFLNVLMSCSSIGRLNRYSVVLNNVLRHEPTVDKWIKLVNMNNKSRDRQVEAASNTR